MLFSMPFLEAAELLFRDYRLTWMRFIPNAFELFFVSNVSRSQNPLTLGFLPRMGEYWTIIEVFVHLFREKLRSEEGQIWSGARPVF